MSSLDERVGALGPDVQAALIELIEKAERGQEKHGRLSIAGDSRDFEFEARSELLDCVWYLSYELVRLKREVARLRDRMSGPRPGSL